MTIYFDKRAEEAQDAEAEEQKQKEESVKAAAQAIAFFVKPVVLMLLWNWLMPTIFGLVTIGYFKALGLCIIARIIIDKND